MALRSPTPTADEILGAGIAALKTLRPRAFALANLRQGRWWHVFAGFRAQIVLALRRQADEAQSTRLPLATGAALLELAADEYETVVDTSATKALGTVTLSRTGTNGGTIRKGTVFRRNEDATQIPIVRAATYEASADVPVNFGVTSGIPVPIVAQRAGSHANAPIIGGAVQGSLSVGVADLFDATFTVTGYEAAGGADGVDENAVRREAKAFASGQYAPTIDAVTAGALRGTGVRYIAVADVAVVQNGTPSVPLPGQKNAAFTSVNPADASWSTSAEWRNSIAQAIADTFEGFGCSFRVGTVNNQTIAVAAAVMLRDSKFLAYTRDIDAAIQAALVDYFDNRPDWWTWKPSQIQAVISRADRRVLTCTSAVVSDLRTGAPIATPTKPVAYASGYALTHYWLTDSAVSTSYSAPS